VRKRRSGLGQDPDPTARSGPWRSRQLGLSLALVVTDPDNADLTGVTNFGPIGRAPPAAAPPTSPHRPRPTGRGVTDLGVTDLGLTGSAVQWWLLLYGARHARTPANVVDAIEATKDSSA
jgi:hypothetical protein